MSSLVSAKDRIRLWNDHLREFHRGGIVCLSRGVLALGEELWTKIVVAVARFNDFNADNDPYGEHDCAVLSVEDYRVLWKVDCFDPSLERLSENPADPRMTCRVLTIMLAEEW